MDFACFPGVNTLLGKCLYEGFIERVMENNAATFVEGEIFLREVLKDIRKQDCRTQFLRTICYIDLKNQAWKFLKVRCKHCHSIFLVNAKGKRVKSVSCQTD